MIYIIGAKLLVETVKQIEKGVAQRIKQDSEKASIAPMIEKKDAKIRAHLAKKNKNSALTESVELSQGSAEQEDKG